MHLIHTILLFLNFFMPSLQASPVDRTAVWLKHADIHELASSLAPSVEIVLNDNRNSYPRAEAEKVLSEFFKRNRPEQLSILHRVEGSSNFKFAVYIIHTSGGVYRVAVSFKNADGAFIINELRIESEKTK